MRRFYMNGGEELRGLFQRAQKNGAATSLDMARPDPDGDSGKVNWRRYLENVLPHVDFFLPSIDELVFMLDPSRFNQLIETAQGGNPATFMTFDEIGRYGRYPVRDGRGGGWLQIRGQGLLRQGVVRAPASGSRADFHLSLGGKLVGSGTVHPMPSGGSGGNDRSRRLHNSRFSRRRSAWVDTGGRHWRGGGGRRCECRGAGGGGGRPVVGRTAGTHGGRLAVPPCRRHGTRLGGPARRWIL